MPDSIAVLGEISPAGVKRGLPAKVPVRTAMAIEVHKQLVEVNNSFTTYVDKGGNRSTSPHGVMMRYNTLIKKHFGHSKEGMPSAMRTYCAGMEGAIADTWQKMMEAGEYRAAIKKKIWAMVKAAAESYFRMLAA